jgi:monothiol glutaredoxin
MSVEDRIRQAIAGNPIVIFMKGSPDFPQCGFSMRASQALLASGARLAHVDVLADPEIRRALPAVSNWPTFPQVFIKGELVGGCDIVLELYQSGELARMVQEAQDGVPA